MNVESYLNSRSKAERLQILRDATTQVEVASKSLTAVGASAGMPLHLAQDLLCMDLSREEQSAIIRATTADSSDELERFLVGQIEGRHQEVAITALQEWLKRTEHAHWLRMTEIVSSSMTPQRVKFSILDATWHAGGRTLLSRILESSFEDLSAAFHALLLQRSVQWDLEHPKATKLALSICRQMHSSPYPDSKALASALIYVARFAPTNIAGFVEQQGISEVWREITRAIHLTMLASDKILTEARRVIASTKIPADFSGWPPLWLRHLMPADLVQDALKKRPTAMTWEHLAGIAPSMLRDSWAQVGGGAGIDETRLIRGFIRHLDPPHVVEAGPVIEEVDSARRYFFDMAYRGIKRKAPDQTANAEPINDFFSSLATSWTAPGSVKIADLALKARQAPAVFRICYINTLQRQKGQDEAALKLLDFIRSSEEDELRAVIHAFGGIDTPRATQELVSTLTRPNASLSLQLEICQILRNKDLAGLQPELRSAIADISYDPKKMMEEGKWELREALTTLLLPMEVGAVSSGATGAPSRDLSLVDAEQIDNQLANKIPHYKTMSSEVRRALRTAQFLHNKVKEMAAPGTIDLSPIIDMQYKALELLFREIFEDPCSRVIQQGVLQRKLDVIGYARPIPHQMDDFENYIASLPIVTSIPFFSKFKMRKMLRAICQFRPGKRFTLDGLKAFGLFFLIFSRQTCRHGLQNSFAVPFASDKELAEFCKNLHVFQDFRNRAVHEGLHPDASNDIDGIWTMTGQIIAEVDRLRNSVSGGRVAAPRPGTSAQIQRKVS